MTSVLDTAVLVAKETTYGTAVTPTRGYEAQADTFQRTQEPLTATGFRAGLQAERSASRQQINMGGEGTLEFEIRKTGFGLLLQSMLGSITGPTQQAATIAYKSTAQTTSDDPNDSFTIQVQKDDMGGTQRIFTFKGSVVTGWSIAAEVGGFAMASFNFDSQEVKVDVGAGTPSYPTGAPFDWTECLVSIDGTNTDVTSLSLEADLGLNVDRRFLRSSELKKMPCRAAQPTFSGTLEKEFVDNVLYSSFVGGSIIPIIFTFTGANIASTYNEELKITMEACQFDAPATPQANLNGVPTQSLPFTVLWDETNPAIKIEYTSTDTAL